MASIRVYQLAKELNTTSKDVLAYLRGQGVELASHMSSLTDEQVAQLAKHFGAAAGTAAGTALKDAAASRPAVAEAERAAAQPGGVKAVSAPAPQAGSGARMEEAAPKPPERPPVRTVPLDRIFGPGKGRRPGGPAGIGVESGRTRPDEGGARPAFGERRDLPQARRPPLSAQGDARRGGSPPVRSDRPERPERLDRVESPPRADRPERSDSFVRFERVERSEPGRPGAYRTDRVEPRRGMPEFWTEEIDLSAGKDKRSRAERVQGKAKDVRAGERIETWGDRETAPRTERRRVVRTPDRRRAVTYPIPGSASPPPGSIRKKFQKKKKLEGQSAAPAPEPTLPKVQIPDLLSVKEFADLSGKNVGEVIKELLRMGQMMTANQTLNTELATKVGARLGVEVVVQTGREEFAEELSLSEATEGLQPRPPVITVMGHVDHGKTSLLDAIRSTEVAASEAGGITQHIGASVVHHKGQRLVFLDTPGHEAFTAMRSRGAEITDIVVLVVAADDGVMPQTVEAVNHAKSAEVPILVAVNKIDKPGADAQRIKTDLARYGLNPEEWGGDTIYCEVSAKKRIGLDNLLDMLLLLAEVQELKANPAVKALGTVIEAKLDKGRGPVATVLVQSGSLHVGDPFVVGSMWGKVRAMYGDKGDRISSADPSTPVEVLGLSGVPDAGDTFHVIDDEGEARLIAQRRAIEDKRKVLATLSRRMKLEDLFSKIQEGEAKELNIILKADVQGSVEAISDALLKLNHPKVKVQIVARAVGTVTESDVLLATTTDAIIIAYNVVPEPRIRKLAEEKGVDIRLHTIIYEVLDEIRNAMEGLLDPTIREEEMGRAEVRNTFNVPKVGTVAGCMVTDGKISRSGNARLIRDGKIVWSGKLASLKRFKDDVREVAQGFECGIGLDGFGDVKIGDFIVLHTVVKEKSTLS
jgi:translation initiation factor IF-2